MSSKFSAGLTVFLIKARKTKVCDRLWQQVNNGNNIYYPYKKKSQSVD